MLSSIDFGDIGLLVAILAIVLYVIVYVIIPLAPVIHQMYKDRKTEKLQFEIDIHIYDNVEKIIATYQRYQNYRGLEGEGLNHLFGALRRKGYSVSILEDNIYIITEEIGHKNKRMVLVVYIGKR